MKHTAIQTQKRNNRLPPDYVAREAVHEADLYYGVAVDCLKFPDIGGRFWFKSRTPGKAWIVAWSRQVGHGPYKVAYDRYPFPLLISTAWLDISENASDPPRLPAWATENPPTNAKTWWRAWAPARSDNGKGDMAESSHAVQEERARQ